MVTVGLTVGSASVEVKPVGLETQLYVSPPTAVAPICVGVPAHIVAGLPALAVGNGFTVNVTLFVFVQEVAVIVSVNV